MSVGEKKVAGIINYLVVDQIEARCPRRSPDAGRFISRYGARPFVRRKGDQVFYRFSKSTYASSLRRRGTTREPAPFLSRDTRSRLIYARRLRADYSTSARLYLVINHWSARSALSGAPARRVRPRDERIVDRALVTERLAERYRRL